MPRDLSKIVKVLGATKAHIKFLTRCSKNKIIPNGLISKQRIFTNKSEKLEERFTKIRLRELLNSLHAKAFMLKMAADTYPNKENYKLTAEHLKKIQDREYFKKSKSHAKQFAILKAKMKKTKEGRNLKMDAVINLSGSPLSEMQARVLARGFKFRPTIPELPIKEFIVATESVINTGKLDSDTAALLRNTVVTELKRMQYLEKKKPTKSNLSKAEWAAVKQIQSETNTIIIPADKGDKSIKMDYNSDEQEGSDGEENLEPVVIQHKTYLEKMSDRIKHHHPLAEDPAPMHEKKLNAALSRIKKQGIKKVKGNEEKVDIILKREELDKYKTEGAIPPQLRGQLKEHKPPEMPMREIANATNSPGHELAKVLNKVFEPYTGKTKTAVKGGKHLIEMIKEGRFDKEFLASCDAVALYPSILIQEGLELLEEKIKKDRTFNKRTDLTKAEVIELTRIYTENPYFECELGFFSQQKGTHMGGPLSRLLADLIIENKIEKKIREHPKWKKHWDWVRLIDDTLSGWESEEVFDEFFEFLNTLHPGIQWTCEKEKEGKLAIFDIQISREGNKLRTTVYRKASSSDRYIHYTSWQSWREKACAIRTLKNRATLYCSDEELLAEELAYLLDVFIQNGYPAQVVYRMLYEENNKEHKQRQEIDFKRTFYVPYHSRAKKLYKLLQEKFGIYTVYRKTTTLGDLILRKGRQIEKQYKKHAVYKVPCKQCDKAYIGQTKNSTAKRNSQHKAVCRRKLKLKALKSAKKDNGLAFHHQKTGHEFDFENTEILCQDKSYWRRLILEGIAIKYSENLVNLQAGYMIDKCWTAFLDETEKG